MKLRIVTLAALAAIAGQAHALTIADIATKRALPATNPDKLFEVHFSGASALSAVIGGLFTQNCVAGTLDTYVSNFTDGAFAGDTANGQSVKAYTCRIIVDTASVKNDFGPAFSGKYVVFQKSDQGGSGNGVFPVAYSQTLPFLNLTAANCAGLVCNSNGYVKAPDGGVSDVAPTGFNPDQNRPAVPVDFTDTSLFPNVSNSNFARVDGVVNTVFGLAVSTPLYTALQADQGLAATVRPTVPKAVIASMLANTFDPSISWKALLPNSPAVNEQQINICRRVNGSGTQTSANAFFLEYPRNALSLLPATNAGNSEFANDINNIGNAGLIMVYEGSSSGNVRSCLDKANDTASFAIGHISLENAETAKWKFAAVDGAVASRDNAKKGHYHYAFESTMQINNAAPATQKSFLNGMIDSAKKSVNLNSLPAAAQNGVMALPTAADCAAAPFGGYAAGSTAEKFCSRVSRPGVDDVLIIAR
ncbi:MAG: hypothetical protein Q7V20_01990 [Aquabacterium sp.]|uniref:hypothetical protein n=1 Tax=Aquabacterium sp. TaxID=1872578 RepID=UPI002728E449|nr:hypothetical protein [Aquabacterium sp.]MDO9002206.1 hypothetical protein [Aquabacterium sp.]